MDKMLNKEFLAMKSLKSQIISEDERIARVLLFSFLVVLVSSVVVSLVRGSRLSRAGNFEGFLK